MPPAGFKHLTEVQRGQVHALRQSGLSYAKISRQTSIAYVTVRETCIKAEERGNYKELPKSGRPRKLSERAENALARASRSGREARRIPFAELGQNTLPPHCPRVSGATVSRVLKRHNLKREWESIKCKLNDAKAAARLQWALAHRDWSVDQWMKVCWLDESSISCYSDAGRQHATRLPQERYHKDCVKEEGTDKRISVMVWGCFIGGQRGPLKIFEGTTRAVTYLPVLQEHLPGFMTSQGSTVFMQDNSRVHTANIVKDWLQEQDFEVFTWPATSPDMNPIEHVWRRLKALFGEHHPEIRYSTRGEEAVKDAMQQVLPELWEMIDSDFLESLARSMPRRIRAVIEARGWYTKY